MTSVAVTGKDNQSRYAKIFHPACSKFFTGQVCGANFLHYAVIYALVNKFDLTCSVYLLDYSQMTNNVTIS
jgi:hypothetical protein